MEKGHVVPGMDREQVWTVLGEPVQRRTVAHDQMIEIWLYQGYKLHQDQMRADSATLFRAVFRDGIIIDPYARADFFLAIGEEGIEVEEGFVTFPTTV